MKSADESTRGGWGLGRLDLGSFMRRIARVLEFRGQESEPGISKRTGTALEEIRAKCLEAVEKYGKLAGLVAVAEVADAYARLEEEERGSFFKMLHEDFSVDALALDAAIAAYRAARDSGSENADADPAGAGVAKALVELTRTLESPRHVLFRQFNTIPSGIKFLVDLRADLYPFLKRDASLAPLEYELRRLLEAFFNLGFLRLERIGWESPAVLLENLIRYEAVHRISNWVDLKHRLVSDRACFAFIHPSLPTEPVIFVEVALTRGIADNVQRL
ncbi:MAG: malonyl-CoA decarboxylase family protein, partial [bacterium]